MEGPNLSSHYVTQLSKGAILYAKKDHDKKENDDLKIPVKKQNSRP